MVSINSSSNAWANWNSRNPTPPVDSTSTSGSTATTPPETTSPAPSPALAANDASPVITATPQPALVYTPHAPTEIGQAVKASQSLDGLLTNAGFFTRSAAAQTMDAGPASQAAGSVLPAALSQSEVIARAAYALVAEAGTESSTASVIKQFG
ncbi:hypothetical protein BV96_00439 [Sphingomonas paucimobilis]|uniref:hypothetical protein n=1 Tax=Sphingobium sp. DC-2 TaxID=1303256 RepID=UPI0004476199|nr:hypothetical protein [Sphingobium sp. DC-2]EZP74351.1 hypothetical protein BV96_00439 [Sphingomonas paucimobilis]